VKNLFYLLFLSLPLLTNAQGDKCVFKDPVVNINFGSGVIGDRNLTELYNYRHVSRSCPTDGHYTYTSYTSDCFRGDWLTLSEDHTPGDVDGNMMLVNASPSSGTFFATTVSRLKSGTVYEFSAWFMNVCRPTEKCPYPLLPNISIVLQTPDGKVVAQILTGELVRRNEPEWTRYQAIFTTPASETPLNLIMVDNAPGGCGNDFALDDISFRECVKVKPVVKNTPKPTVPVNKQTAVPNTVVKKVIPAPEKKPVTTSAPPAKKQPETIKPEVKKPVPVVPKKETEVARKPMPQRVVKPDSNTIAKRKPAALPPPIAVNQAEPPVTNNPQGKLLRDSLPVTKPKRSVLAPPPPLVSSRSNPLIKRLETAAGEIRVDLYDNGQIDGDTVSVYHNNRLLVSHERLSVKPITFRIAVDAGQSPS
jgi:hypothetical protein